MHGRPECRLSSSAQSLCRTRVPVADAKYRVETNKESLACRNVIMYDVACIDISLVVWFVFVVIVCSEQTGAFILVGFCDGWLVR